MGDAYQHLGTELTSLETKNETKAEEPPSPRRAEEKKGEDKLDFKDYQKPLKMDVAVQVYSGAKSRNWTFDPIKYAPSQEELHFLDRTTCQLIGGGAALGSALYGLIVLAEFPWWVVAPFALSVWGLTIGCIWDIWNHFNPGNRWLLTVRCYRQLNATFVAMFLLNNLIFMVTSSYNYIAKSVPLNAWYFVLFMVATYVGFNALLGHHKGPGPMITALTFSITTQQIILISAKVNGIPEIISDVEVSGWILLMACSILNWVGLASARHISLYHGVMCITMLMLNFALRSWGKDFCYNTRYGSAQPNFWYIFLGWVIGMGLVFFYQPLQRNTFRRSLMTLLWFRVWAKSLSLPPWDPVPLDLKKNKNQPFIGTKAFWLGARIDDVSGYRRADGLCIPIGEFIPPSQYDRVDGTSVKPIFGKGGMFDQLSYLDARFSQSRADTDLRDKVRFLPGQDGAYWFPIRLGFTGPPPSPAPSVVQAKHQGTLLEFLVWYGHLSPELRKVTAADREALGGDLEGATHVVDLEWMAQFEVKPDYHRTGGRAFFKFDPQAVRLHVQYLTRPGEIRKIYPQRNPLGETHWEFDQAEQIILTSSYALVVAGYHAGGIHVMMNLLAIALHNGFDTNDGNVFHPWRLAMHLHFFNHIVVNDSTTGHLLEHTAIFVQIFPWTINGLYNFLHTVVQNYEYMSDADLETRKAVTDGIFPAQSTLVWEERYKKIYVEYARMIADLCWKDDSEVQKDTQMQKFLKNLASNIPKGLPQRFRSKGVSVFTSKEQVVEFMASAIHIVTCRHEVYGTLFGNWAYEPSIMQSQLALDYGPPAVNDFQAMVGIAMATSRKPATKLMIREEPMPGEKTTVGLPKNEKGAGMRDFKYLIRNLPEGDDALLGKAFDFLQAQLNALYVDMAGTREKREMANWFLHVTPEMLELGAGY